MLTHPETQSIYDEAVPKLPMAVTYLIGKPVLSSIKESSSAIRSVSASDIFSSPCGTGEVASTPTESSGVCVCMPNFSLRSLTVHRCGLKYDESGEMSPTLVSYTWV